MSPNESSSDFSEVFCCSIKDLKQMSSCQELHCSCRDHGYFFINDFDSEELKLENVFSEVSNFFKLPLAEKLKNQSLSSTQYLGYRGIGTEKSLMTGSAELCEQYKFGYFHDNNHSSTLRLNYLSAYESIFKKYVSSYFSVMEQIATTVLMTIANNLKLGQDYFSSYCDQPTHQMGLNYYPVGNVKEKICQNDAMSAHKDLCLLTIIAQDQAGLMIQNLKGEWKLIPYGQNTLLVLLGDYLERWTNNYYLAPTHRVLESTENARFSLIYKHRPNYATVIPVIKGINPKKEHDNEGAEFHTGKAYAEKIHRIMSNGKY